MHIQLTDRLETVHWHYSDMRSVSWSTAEYICLPTCLSVCLWACLFVYQQGIFPLASDLYKLRHCLGLKHYFFRDIFKSKQSKLVNTKKKCGGDFGPQLVAQVVSLSVQCSKGFEHEQKNCLHVCLSATSLLSSFL